MSWLLFYFLFIFIVYLNVFIHKFLKDIKLLKGICRFDHPPNDGKHFFFLDETKGVNKGGQFKLNVSWLYGEKLLLVAFLLWCLPCYSDLLFRRREIR